jgi:hypothetical protein
MLMLLHFYHLRKNWTGRPTAGPVSSKTYDTAAAEYPAIA